MIQGRLTWQANNPLNPQGAWRPPISPLPDIALDIVFLRVLNVSGQEGETLSSACTGGSHQTAMGTLWLSWSCDVWRWATAHVRQYVGGLHLPRPLNVTPAFHGGEKPAFYYPSLGPNCILLKRSCLRLTRKLRDNSLWFRATHHSWAVWLPSQDLSDRITLHCHGAFSGMVLLDRVTYRNTIILLEIAFLVFLLYVRHGIVLIVFSLELLSMDFTSG